MMMFQKYPSNDAMRDRYWFVQKRFGYGAVPVTFAGWVATFTYVALIGLEVQFIPSTTGKIVIGTIVTVGYLILVWKKTKGGWRWRWGQEEE